MFSPRSNLKGLTNQSSNQDVLTLGFKAAGPVCPLNRLRNETVIPIEMTGGLLQLSERSPTNHRGSRSKLHWIDGFTPRFTLTIEQSNRIYDPSELPVDTNQSTSQSKVEKSRLGGKKRMDLT